MSRKKWLKFLTTFILGLVALAWLRVDAGSRGEQRAENREQGEIGIASSSTVSHNDIVATTSTNALAIRAVDGDTIEVRIDGASEDVKVRLLGVDTPESVDPRRPVECFGKEASKYTASHVDGRRVRLEADPKADEVDKYGRLLRNVILADGTDLNASLVSDGYAHAYLSFPLDARRKAELTRLQEGARLAKRGLWNPDTCSSNP
jgi:micrococcal nuclease